MNSVIIATNLPFSQHKFDIQVKCYHVSMQTPVYFIIEALMTFVLRWWVLVFLILLDFKRLIKWNYFVWLFGPHSSHFNNFCINNTLHFETSLLQKIWEPKLYCSCMKSSGRKCMEPLTRQIKIIKKPTFNPHELVTFTLPLKQNYSKRLDNNY